MPPGRTSNEHSCPIQRVALAESTRNSHTVSGLAAIATSRSSIAFSAVLSMLSPLLSFCLAFERLQPVSPEVVEERPQLDDPLRAGPVQAPGAVASLAHEPRLLQHAQMLGDRRPRQLEVRRDLAGGQLRLRDEPQDRAAVRRGDRFQSSLHDGAYLSRCLRKLQLKDGEPAARFTAAGSVERGHAVRPCIGGPFGMPDSTLTTSKFAST